MNDKLTEALELLRIAGEQHEADMPCRVYRDKCVCRFSDYNERRAKLLNPVIQNLERFFERVPMQTPKLVKGELVQNSSGLIRGVISYFVGEHDNVAVIMSIESGKEIGRWSVSDLTRVEPTAEEKGRMLIGAGYHPSVLHVLQFFACGHLPDRLKDVVRPFRDLATQCADRAPQSQETTVCLRKLLEAKDAAVRAAL
jgi:hypothetical protein